MLIKGVGVDIVQIFRIENLIKKWGDKFLNRLFTEHENLEARRVNLRYRARFYAMRFAAKEAFSKAIGTGIRHPVTWKAIEVRSEKKGRPYIVLSSEAEEFCNRKGINRWHLSLSDEKDYAVAFVVVTGLEG